MGTMVETMRSPAVMRAGNMADRIRAVARVTIERDYSDLPARQDTTSAIDKRRHMVREGLLQVWRRATTLESIDTAIGAVGTCSGADARSLLNGYSFGRRQYSPRWTASDATDATGRKALAELLPILRDLRDALTDYPADTHDRA